MLLDEITRLETQYNDLEKETNQLKDQLAKKDNEIEGWIGCFNTEKRKVRDLVKANQELKEGLKEIDAYFNEYWGTMSTTWLEVYDKMQKLQKKIQDLINSHAS